MLKVIVAVADNGVIGNGLQIPWRLPDDMKWFKEQTINHTVVMGRKTWVSIPERFRPLPDRVNIVLSRQEDFQPNALVMDSWEKVLLLSKEIDVFIIGGAELYRLALPVADEVYLTRLLKPYEGDIFFPEWDRRDEDWDCIHHVYHSADDKHECGFTWAIYRRLRPL